MQVQGGDIITKQKFDGKFKLHVEFRVPYVPKASGQGRGNSGVYLQGRYEVQVLDSYGLKSKNNDCGGIYTVAAPLVNACKAPTVWQSYDIDFQSPALRKRQESPSRASSPSTTTASRFTTMSGWSQEGDKEEFVTNTTAGLGGDPCTPGPILLQDHGNPVQYPQYLAGAASRIDLSFSRSLWHARKQVLTPQACEPNMSCIHRSAPLLRIAENERLDRAGRPIDA